MYIDTTRFGRVDILEHDVLTFPLGLIGMEQRRKWVVLADAKAPALAWLQSTDRAEIALAVVNPRRFIADYRARVSRRDLTVLGISESQPPQVVTIVSKTPDGLALNLKAPLVICLETKRGRQVVAKDDHAVRYVLGATIPFRQSA